MGEEGKGAENFSFNHHVAAKSTCTMYLFCLTPVAGLQVTMSYSSLFLDTSFYTPIQHITLS